MAYAPPYGGDEFQIENQRISRNHLVLELGVFYFHEKGDIVFRVGYALQGQQSSALCHGLYLQNSGHNRGAGEVTYEEGLVHSHVLYAHNVCVGQFHHFIHQKERRTMGEHLYNVVYVHKGLLVQIELRHLVSFFGADYFR